MKKQTTTPTGGKLEALYKIFDGIGGMSLQEKSLKAYRRLQTPAAELEQLALQHADQTRLRLCGPLDVYLQQLDLPSQNYITAESRYVRVAFRREISSGSPYINVSIRLSTGKYNSRSNKLEGTKYISGDYFLDGDETHASFDKLENDLIVFGLKNEFHSLLDKVVARATGATSRNNLRKLVCD